MRLFGKKKQGATIETASQDDEGMVGLYFTMLANIEKEYCKFVAEHLERIHQPGGYDREKRENDFMNLGMRMSYLDALDDIQFAVVESISMPETRGRNRGKGLVLTRWTVRGVHARPLLNIPPTGEQVTIDGMTYTNFRDYKIRVEYNFWELPSLTRSVLES